MQPMPTHLLLPIMYISTHQELCLKTYLEKNAYICSENSK